MSQMVDFVLFPGCEDIEMAESTDSAPYSKYNDPVTRTVSVNGSHPSDRDAQVPNSILAEPFTLSISTQSDKAMIMKFFHCLQQSDSILKMQNWSLEQKVLDLEMQIGRLKQQILQQDCVLVRRDEQEDRLSGIDEQVECIRNDIDIMVDRILELEKNKPGGESKEYSHADADISGAETLLNLAKRDIG